MQETAARSVGRSVEREEREAENGLRLDNIIFQLRGAQFAGRVWLLPLPAACVTGQTFVPRTTMQTL